MIEIELLKRGYMTIHAAAVSYKNKGYLLVGRGGVYKTTLSMWLVRQNNYSFLGDDKVLLNQSGVIFSYQTLPSIFMFRVKNLKDERISLVQKFRFIFQEVANKKSKMLQQSQSTLAGLIFLSRTERYTDPRRIPKDEAIKKLMANYRIEKVSSQGLGGYSISILGNLLLCHEFIYPDSEISALDDKYTSLCKKVIQHDGYYELYAENDFNEKYFNCVLNAIEGAK